ncbi:MAG: septum formation protein Maf [Firmicutes bacterium]|nr:septum formation protein Maf [Bacillota bacterium]
MRPLILASASPRRAELLEQVGYTFEVCPGNAREEVGEGLPSAGVESLALKKSLSVAPSFDRGAILGADTVVCCDGKTLGKPVDEDEAIASLKLLSGRRHEVITGIALVDAAGEWSSVTDHLCTEVWWRDLDEEEILHYVRSGEPMDKAGAYGIQGFASVFVERLEGCYFNVMGLPLGLVYRHLARWGIKPF